MTETYKSCSTANSIESSSYGIEGPGNGLGYYASYLYPENTFATSEDADKAARLMNLAYRQGELARAAKIKALLE